ncbi:MAG: phospho-sugar mutase [Myxococcales bacterium]|nr:phospho-sugar mutase [Myxococcales bacterium]
MANEQWIELVLDGFSQLAIDQAKKDAALKNLVRWLDGGAYADFRTGILTLIEQQKWDLLLYNFFQTMPFGTGGRRGPVGIGPNCYNAYTLSTSVQGHIDYMCAKFGKRPHELSVVVAFDVRVFNDIRRRYTPNTANSLLGVRSRDFAAIAAEVYAGNGVKVFMPQPYGDWFMSTPELSFAIRHLGAHGGLNISASHNHPDDNGGKFYDHRGGQEVPPNDERFSMYVDAVENAAFMEFAEAVTASRIVFLDHETIHSPYIALNVRQSQRPKARSAKVVLTNLHGTGDTNVGDTLRSAGFEVWLVEDQKSLDGTFPNVPFGIANPEVPETMEKATELAKIVGADLVLATDPDADRIGLIVPDRHGNYLFLTGNEIGALVVDQKFSRLAQDGLMPKNPLFVTTEVTSRLPVALAKMYGAHVIGNLLVGVKYIANVLASLEDNGQFDNFRGDISDYVIGLEESHGVLVTPHLRDKDAAGPALLLAERASEEKAAGRTLYDALYDAWRNVGIHLTRQVSIVIEGAIGMEQIAIMQAGFRQLAVDDHLGGQKIVSVDDFWNTTTHGPFSSETDRTARNLVSFTLENGYRVLSRPSGTEPKIKLYVEAIGRPLGTFAGDDDVNTAKDQLDAALQQVTDTLAQQAYAFLGLDMPVWGLRVSPLLGLTHRRDFVEKFLVELADHAQKQPLDILHAWAQNRLATYGKDPLALVKNGVAAWLSSGVSEDLRNKIRACFSLNE